MSSKSHAKKTSSRQVKLAMTSQKYRFGKINKKTGVRLARPTRGSIRPAPNPAHTHTQSGFLFSNWAFVALISLWLGDRWSAKKKCFPENELELKLELIPTRLIQKLDRWVGVCARA